MTSIPDFVYDIVKKRIERDIMWYLISGADTGGIAGTGKGYGTGRYARQAVL